MTRVDEEYQMTETEKSRILELAAELGIEPLWESILPNRDSVASYISSLEEDVVEQREVVPLRKQL